MKTEETDIAMLTETKGKPPALEGFTWYLKERKAGKGGGVAIAAKDNLTNYISQPDVVESDEVEISWIELNQPRRKKIFLGCYYGLQEKKRTRKCRNTI